MLNPEPSFGFDETNLTVFMNLLLFFLPYNQYLFLEAFLQVNYFEITQRGLVAQWVEGENRAQWMRGWKWIQIWPHVRSVQFFLGTKKLLLCPELSQLRL